MASITLAEAAKLSQDEVVAGIVEDIVTQDNWYQYLPFVQIKGLNYAFQREATLGTVDFAGIGQDLSGDEYRTGATFENVNVGLAAIVGEILIDAQIDDQFSDISDQLQVQISSKAKSFARYFMNAIINYGSNGFVLDQANHGKIGAFNFDRKPIMKGMRALLEEEVGNADDVNHPFYNNGAATQTFELVEEDADSARVGKAGAFFTLEDLDRLLDAVTIGPEFLLCNNACRRHLRVLLRNTGGGTDSTQIMRQDLGSGNPLLHYQGIPVFVSQFISDVEPVHKVHSTAVTINAMNVGANTITLDSDISAEITAAIAGIKNIADGVYLVVRAGLADKFRKHVIKVTGVAGAVLTYDPNFKYKNDELNKLIVTNLTGLDTAQGLVNAACEIYERIDGTSIYCGKFGEHEGFCGFTMENKLGINIRYVGPRRDHDQDQYRMKWYVGAESYSRLALARMKSILLS